MPWLGALRVYLLVSAVLHPLWEIAQLPLYTIWQDASARGITVAILHCSAGDLLIAVSALVAALALGGRPGWPRDGFLPVLGLSLAIGVGYTIYSEWLNIGVRQSWAYSGLMPVVPSLGTGLSPLLQWIAIPLAGHLVARRVVSRGISAMLKRSKIAL